ncbi:hypothetical protein ACFQ9X_12305 [Catenulispora yoronensis]
MPSAQAQPTQFSPRCANPSANASVATKYTTLLPSSGFIRPVMRSALLAHVWNATANAPNANTVNNPCACSG